MTLRTWSLVAASAIVAIALPMVVDLPKILLWNPLVHTIELSRKSLFPLYHITPDVNLAYPASVAIVIFSVGICFFHNNRHFLTQR